MGNSVSYELDAYGWALEQVALLRNGRLSEADIENIAEEIEDMGQSLKRELVNRLAVILTHLLKWRYQPNLRGNSWRLSLVEQRKRVAKHLEDNPSLRRLLPTSIETAYDFGRIKAMAETGLPDASFPETCPWPGEQVLAIDFLPD